jgi:hypothetical protein
MHGQQNIKFVFSVFIYTVYIYIYVCVCVCVCLRARASAFDYVLLFCDTVSLIESSLKL